MELLPSSDERKWLGRYLRKLIERSGWETFALAPLLEPSNESFPDRWDRRVADVHRLTQRLMHHAGLGDLEFSLSGFEGASTAWDANTAGWFAGIEDGRCKFGVHIRQLRDPEAAVGVMAHEVAHAWRHHHHLVADARDREELLTDLTTIYLGFGILTTNNTDRYRSSGDAQMTSWSVSSAGYLPPQSMSWLLALQASARGRRHEIRAIAKNLEPNQQACFEAAMHEMEIDWSYVDALELPPRETWPEPRAYVPIAVREPHEDEIVEPPADEEETIDHNRNAGQTVYRTRSYDAGLLAWLGITIGPLFGLFASLIAFGDNYDFKFTLPIFGGLLLGILIGRNPWTPHHCSDPTCQTRLPRRASVCPGCGGTIDARKRSNKELQRIREEELDRRAAAEIEWEECAECKPEVPCRKHAVA